MASSLASSPWARETGQRSRLLHLLQDCQRLPEIRAEELEDHVIGLKDAVEHCHGKHLHLLGMPFEQDLGQDGSGQVLAGLAVANLDLLALMTRASRSWSVMYWRAWRS